MLLIASSDKGIAIRIGLNSDDALIRDQNRTLI